MTICSRISGGSFRGVQASGDHSLNFERRFPPLAASDPAPGDAGGDAVGIRHAAPDHQQCRGTEYL